MPIERYLLEDKYLEPLGWCLIGLSIVTVEGYTYTQSGVTQAGGVMLVIGLASVAMGVYRWTERETIQNADSVSVFKHIFLAAVLLVIVGGQLFGLP